MGVSRFPVIALSSDTLIAVNSTSAPPLPLCSVLVLDESHKLKNSETSTYKAARTLRQSAQYCIGLTGAE